ncbi:hypothetical protein ACEWY4_012187 [Coilia grayii]|uniref:DNA polymerase kappa n=1 Tax=Coilia grayii TaxID=363190 RepID=A0ABD1JZT3_9TELE
MDEHARDVPGPVPTATAEEGMLSRMGLNDNKAGMEGLDREKINKIILETSKGSKFYESELKKERQMNQRIEKMMEQKAKITEQHLTKAQAQVDKMRSELERRRKLGRVMVHVDMDAFYAAVEMRDCPELKDKPMAVGSMSMLSTSNYHARRFGVRAAMPGFIAKKLCPHLVIMPVNFDKYRAVSAQVREVFADYDPNFLPLSLDEAYLDITDHLEQRPSWPESMRTHYTICSGKDVEMTPADSEVADLSPVLFDDSPSELGRSPEQPGSAVVFGTSAEEAVREMRFRIEQKTSLTASAGIAPNTMLAKVCSDKNKPNGQYRIPADSQAVMDFIQDLPVRKVPGIGKVTEKLLGALDIRTCSQLGQKMALLSLLFSETSWHHFLEISLGLGSTHLERDGERKSMSTERTFSEMSDTEEQMSLCRELCEDLAQDLTKEGLKGKTVTLKLKNVSFEVKTRASTLQCAVSTADEIFAAAKDLLRVEIDGAKPEPLRLRLMGVRVSGFVGADDKRAQQKSIMGFLQSGGGGSDLGRAGDPKPRADPGTAPSTTKAPLAPTEAPRAPLTWGRGRQAANEGQPQQSFFQRAQAQRRHLQPEQGSAAEPVAAGASCADNDAVLAATLFGLPETDAVQSSHTEADSDKGRVTGTTPSSAMSAPSIPAAGTPSESAAARSSAFAVALIVSDSPPCTSASVAAFVRPTPLPSLTCPVCFKNMHTTDLEVFNQHIDACLSTGQPEGTVTLTEERQDEESQVRPHPECLSDPDANTGARPSTPDAVSDEACLHSDKEGKSRSGLPDNTSSLAIPSGIPSLVPVPTEEPAGGEGATPALTCPVCSQPQSTADLAVFNRHVDECLNRETLQELQGGGASTTTNSSFSCPQLTAPLTSQPQGRGQPMQRRANSRGKSKRSGSPPAPPSKKSKVAAAAPRNTIDRFFR